MKNFLPCANKYSFAILFIGHTYFAQEEIYWKKIVEHRIT
jgi:hypothetical protein